MADTFRINPKLQKAKIALAKYGYALYKPYQEQGVEWLLRREATTKKDGTPKKKPYGGFICDEMGLGKTIQMISLIMANPLPNTLLVLPASLISQWVQEFSKFAPEMKIVIHHGEERVIHSKEITERDLNQPIVWITSYSLFRGIHGIPTVFQRIYWDRVIVEECHYFRNPKSGISRTIMKIKSNIKWGITGTPIQNRMLDLYTLFRFLGIKAHTVKDNLEFIKTKFILRRTKDMVKHFNSKLALPPSTVQVVNTSFKSTQELNLYKKVYGEVRQQLDVFRKFDFSQIHILELILRLRQASILPQLVLDGYSKKFKTDTVQWKYTNSKLDNVVRHLRLDNNIKGGVETNILEGGYDFQMDIKKPKRLNILPSNHTIKTSNSSIHHPIHHSIDKAIEHQIDDAIDEAIDDDIDEAIDDEDETDIGSDDVVDGDEVKIGENNRTIIFTNFKIELDYLYNTLTRMGYRVHTISGDKSLDDRAAVISKCHIDDVKSNEFVDILLVQIYAGGTGLNLYMFNHVYFTSPTWNPALEMQAIARAHRIGQKKDVLVKKFVLNSKNISTIDKRILDVQEAKFDIIQLLY